MSKIELTKRLASAVSSSLPLIMATGAVVTMFTAATYAGSCSQLAGFPGFLQRVGMVAAGPCETKPGGRACQSGTECTAPSAKRGKCKNIGTPREPKCACVEKTVSSGLD
jgi:hypothetical protein